jgi:hypothetical protein
MREINRSVLIPKPRAPFLAWVQSLDSDSEAYTLDQLRDDCAALLVPEMDDPEDVDEFVQEYHGPLFEYLLAEWADDPVVWPAQRDLQTLRDWFDFEVSTLVFDVCDWALEHIEEPE